MSIPDAIIFSRISAESVDGPMVQMMFVRRMLAEFSLLSKGNEAESGGDSLSVVRAKVARRTVPFAKLLWLGMPVEIRADHKLWNA